jgi:serine/threonine-protein kinase
MGELFKARNTRTERRVALKLLRPDAKGRADAVERFRREARAAGMINSEHVTQVLDIQDDPQHGIVIAFELLEGENLLDFLRRTGPMPFDALFPMIDQVLRGLIDAHAVGIIHRDLKPSNIYLLTRSDGSTWVKILDLGISKLPKTIAKTTLTEPGQALGSFMFMPPEQIQRAANVDHRADIYALGTMVFQALTGHLPYKAQGMIELVQMKTSAPPRTLEQASGKAFPAPLQGWVSRCIAPDQEARFPTASEAANAWRALRAQLGSTGTTTTPPTSAPGRPTPVPYSSGPALPPGGQPTPVPYSGGPTSTPGPIPLTTSYPPGAPLHQSGVYSPSPSFGPGMPVPGAQNYPPGAYPPGGYGPPPGAPAPYSATGFPSGTFQPSAPYTPQLSGSFVPPAGVAPGAPLAPRKIPPWLLVLAVTLVFTALGVVVALLYVFVL